MYRWKDKDCSLGSSVFLSYLREDGVVIDMWFLTDVDKENHVTESLGVSAKDDYDACLSMLHTLRAQSNLPPCLRAMQSSHADVPRMISASGQRINSLASIKRHAQQDH